MRRDECRAFSLIELLVCVAIIMMIYAVMYGSGSKQGQARSKAACAVNLAQMHLALSVFAADHDGNFPSVTGAKSSEAALSELVPRYTTDTSIFICPGSEAKTLPGAQPFLDRQISYAYYMGLRRDAGTDVPLVSDAQVNSRAKHRGDAAFGLTDTRPGSNHRGFGGNVLFADGHLETLEPTLSRDLPVPSGAVLLNPRP